MKLAILNDVRTSRKVKAICEVWTYDVWGNEEDGYDVNDRSCRDRAMEVEAVVKVSNMPRLPGAKDRYRNFSTSSSFSTEMMVSFEIEEKELKAIFGRCALDIDGDGEHYYVNRARDGYPLGELHITGWKDEEGDGPDQGEEEEEEETTIEPPIAEEP